VTTDAQGNAAYAFTPAVFNGGIKLGTDAAGNLYANNAASATLPAGVTGASLVQVCNASFQSRLIQIASEIRPVSMGIKWMSTEAALNAQGELAICQIGANAVPGLTSAIAAGGTPASTLINGIQAAQQGTNVANIFDFLHAQMQPAIEEANAIWKPELPNSTAYYSASGNGEGFVGFSNNGYTDLNGLELIYLPGGPYERVVRVDGTISGITADTIQPQPNRLPILMFSFTGCRATATIGEFEFTINYEYIPEEQAGSYVTTTVSTSNPNEMAHASNVLERLPSVSYPKVPTDPGTATLTAAQRTAPTSLYNSSGVATKEGVEGTSFLKKIGAFASGASPFLAKIPGIGGILSTGAAMLGNLLT